MQEGNGSDPGLPWLNAVALLARRIAALPVLLLAPIAG
jgi:hypothetical protein